MKYLFVRLLAGCASQSAMLTNDRGEHRYCYNEADASGFKREAE